LIDSFATVVQRVPNAKLLLVGDGKTRPSIQQKVEECRLQNSVMMMGRIEHEKIPEVMSIADVTVSPSTPFFPGHGGTPLKLFEYMAAGKPTVAIAMSQAVRVIEDGYNGILIQPGDEHGFTNAIVRLLTDPIENARMGANARKRAVEQHSWKKYAEDLENIYWESLDRT
jgi:glycosyltransferase involved in cell wall biosynthesis